MKKRSIIKSIILSPSYLMYMMVMRKKMKPEDFEMTEKNNYKFNIIQAYKDLREGY